MKNNKQSFGCIICGEGLGFLDDYGDEPCYGCNFATCQCGAIIPYNTKCNKCGYVVVYKNPYKQNKKEGNK